MSETNYEKAGKIYVTPPAAPDGVCGECGQKSHDKWDGYYVADGERQLCPGRPQPPKPAEVGRRCGWDSPCPFDGKHGHLPGCRAFDPVFAVLTPEKWGREAAKAAMEKAEDNCSQPAKSVEDRAKAWLKANPWNDEMWVDMAAFLESERPAIEKKAKAEAIAEFVKEVEIEADKRGKRSGLITSNDVFEAMHTVKARLTKKEGE